MQPLQAKKAKNRYKRKSVLQLYPVMQKKSATLSLSRPAKTARPFIKWAGGKGQLLKELALCLPSSFSRYFEPFLGGGAFFFYLSGQGAIQSAYLNDANPDLMNAYRVVQTQPHALLEELLRKKYQNTAKAFYALRAERPCSPLKKAARFIYLNKTAYNGLYRVNARGEFNVPFGRYKNPKLVDASNLLAVHAALQTATLSCLDFEDAVKKARAGDFVYFDPPYVPRSKTASFTAYTRNGFGEREQRRLFRCFQRLDRRGCLLLLSNADLPFVRALYAAYPCRRVFAARAINCNATARGRIGELLVANYPLPAL